MNTATKDYQPSGLRVSDSDRDRAIAELSEHFQAGRITADELEERTGRALKRPHRRRPGRAVHRPAAQAVGHGRPRSAPGPGPGPRCLPPAPPPGPAASR